MTFTDVELLGQYASTHDLPFDLVIDTERISYRSYGLGRGTVRRVYGRRALVRYIELLRGGGWRRLRRPTEDTLQLGGDFVVDPEGNLTWAFWGAGPDDRSRVDDLVRAVTAAR